MKIVHICENFTDGLSYQDNILTKYHKRLGFDVTVIASKWIYDTHGKFIYDYDASKGLNEDGINIIRLEYKNNKPRTYKFKTYEGLLSVLQSEHPNVLFIHGVQWVYLREISKSLAHHKEIITYCDNHADYSNSASSWASRNVLHRLIWRHYVKLITPYTTRFYGVLPARVKILSELYGVPKEKCEYLPLGADDDEVIRANSIKNIESIRLSYGINKDDFLIITGGKIDLAKKQTLLLMEAIRKIDDAKVKLLIYGSVVTELREEFNKLINDNIIYVGWVNSHYIYDLIAASDLVIYPGRHSVLWEQTVAQGIPMIVKYWEGTTHVDIGGNVKFLYEDSEEEIEQILRDLVTKKTEYNKMLKAAQGGEKNKFLYSNIAKQSIREVL